MIRKSTWLKLFQQKIKQRIQKSLREKIRENIKSKGNTANDIIKVELSIWDLKKNFIKEEEELLCSSCEKEDGTTDHIIQCGRDRAKKTK